MFPFVLQHFLVYLGRIEIGKGSKHKINILLQFLLLIESAQLALLELRYDMSGSRQLTVDFFLDFCFASKLSAVKMIFCVQLSRIVHQK